MVKFTDIINIEEEDLSKYKIHFAIGEVDKKKPLIEFEWI